MPLIKLANGEFINPDQVSRIAKTDDGKPVAYLTSGRTVFLPSVADIAKIIEVANRHEVAK